ncbi:MAG: hypothetical protein C0475_03705 [Planctomyces sp.]|nr:hypothetical protein [Planctomyces sp.]
MAAPIRAVVVAFGSAGDVHPMLAVAGALRGRGHHAVVLCDRAAQGEAEAVCPGAVVLDGPGTGGQMIDPRRGHMRRAGGWAGVLRDRVIPGIPALYGALHRAIDAHGSGVLIGAHMALPVGWVARQRGVRWALCATAPASWCSCEDPPMYPFMPDRDRYKRWLVRLGVRLGVWATNAAVDPAVNRQRRRLGLARGRGFMFEPMRQASWNLGLWSPRLRGPAADDPPRSAVCGVAWAAGAARGHAQDAEAARAFLAAGSAPIVVTLGSLLGPHAAGVLDAAERAARELGHRALLLGAAADGRPVASPDGRALRVGYVPHAGTLEHAAAVVHHAGLGTLTQALRAARPGVCVPMIADQFDNARRSRLAGVSVTVAARGIGRGALTAALRRVLGEPAFAQRAAALAQSVRQEDGAARAVEIIERGVAEGGSGALGGGAGPAALV